MALHTIMGGGDRMKQSSRHRAAGCRGPWIRRITALMGVCLLFCLYPPIRSGAAVKVSTEHFLSLFASKASVQTEAYGSEITPVVTVIDTMMENPPAVHKRTDTVTRGIYADTSIDFISAVTEDVPQTDKNIQYRNETSYNPDTDALLAMESSVSVAVGKPQILILHTHTSEAYLPDSQYNYTPDDNDRTLDPAYNVVRVGKALETKLTEAGFTVIHDKTVHDYPSYTGSYSRSRDTADAILKQYPQIDIVIDLHRDAIIGADGSSHATHTTVIKNESPLDSAQLMLVIGTDEGGLSHPDWEKNLSFAVKLQTVLNEQYPTLMRPINLRTERFNQHIAPAAILLEVGASGDTLGDAITAAELFADGLIALFTSDSN